jgi:hypothetical protein
MGEGGLDSMDEAVWARRPDVVETEMGTDISVYDPREERVTVLNATASDIWRLIDGNTSSRKITELLASAYAVDSARIAADVTATLEKLAAQDLIERKS